MLFKRLILFEVHDLLVLCEWNSVSCSFHHVDFSTAYPLHPSSLTCPLITVPPKFTNSVIPLQKSVSEFIAQRIHILAYFVREYVHVRVHLSTFCVWNSTA